MHRPILIIGGGGHTSVLIGMLASEKRDIRGIVTRDAALIGTSLLGVPVLGHQDEIRFSPEEVTLVNGVGNCASRNGSGLGVRAAIFEHYRAQGFAFLPVLSEHAVIQPEVTMGEGVQVMPGAVIQPGAMIGENVILNTRTSIDHDVVIAPHAHIAPGAILCGHAVVGEKTHIGAGAIVIQGIRIGSNAVIGAGAVVTQDVPDNTLIRPAASEQLRIGVVE